MPELGSYGVGAGGAEVTPRPYREHRWFKVFRHRS